MPPRKKSKTSLRANSAVGDDEKSNVTCNIPSNTSQREKQFEKSDYDILKDPWTDEQESSLFKGIVKWKPAGMHRHFRMIAISEHLRNHGYDPTVEKHTRIPRIWEKLKTLYNLDFIDYNESNVDNAKNGGKADVYLEFKLPEEEYDELQFLRGRRNTSEAPSEIASPPLPPQSKRSPITNKKKRKRKEMLTMQSVSTTGGIGDSRSSPAVSLPSKQARRGRPPGRPPKNKVDSDSRAASTTVDELEEIEDHDEDGDDSESIISVKGKFIKGKVDAQITRNGRKKITKN